MALISASASVWSNAAHKSWCIWRVKLFSAWGRFNVTKATAPRFSKVTDKVCSEVMVMVGIKVKVKVKD
jgi:hypothetical protein